MKLFCSEKQNKGYQTTDSPTRHLSTNPNKLGFSNAAATLSLSFSCLFTAASEACDPGDNAISILNLGGSTRRSLTRIHRPISVAMLQCSTVGVNWTRTVPRVSSISMCSSLTTLSCSNVYGCSGSVISLMCSNTSKASMGSLVSSSSSAAVRTCIKICAFFYKLEWFH